MVLNLSDNNIHFLLPNTCPYNNKTSDTKFIGDTKNQNRMPGYYRKESHLFSLNTTNIMSLPSTSLLAIPQVHRAVSGAVSAL